MPNNRKTYRTNSNRIPEHVQQINASYAGINPWPVRRCSSCQTICRSMPLAIFDYHGAVMCDSCADTLNIPALAMKKAYLETLQIFEGYFEVSFDISFYWRVAIKKKEKLRLHLGTKALIETLCERSAAYGMNEVYVVSMENAPVYIHLVSSYEEYDMIEAAFDKAEPELTKLIESGQSEENHVEYFYLIDSMLYPPGMDIGENEGPELDLPSWKWPYKKD